MSLVYFSLAWTAVVYAFNCILARKFKAVSWNIALLYISSVALIGVFGEIFSDSLYNSVVGHALWEYRVLPIHAGYTSYYSIFIWGLYGFYLYLLHDSLSSLRIHSARKLAAIVSIEAIVLEFLFNISHLFIFGEYIFYYLPSDLWHFTSIQAIPFYFLAGIVIVKAMKRFKAEPLFFMVMNGLLVFVVVWLA